MPMYLIRRPFPGADDSRIEAAGYRSEACVPFYEGMRWLQSYWDRDQEVTYCIYEARCEEDIRRHAVQADLPCAEIRPVEAMISHQPDHGTPPPLATPVSATPV